MRVLIFDTETTGFLKNNLLPQDPEQARVVQLAALLMDDETGEHLAKMSTLIKPDGWVVPEKVQAIHGIATEKAEENGIPMLVAYKMFLAMVEKADILVAHNIKFDLDMMHNEMLALEQPQICEFPQKTYCTMLNSIEICKIPGKYGKYKWPKLSEVYDHFFGESIIGAHDALVDVEACAKVYIKLRGK